MGRVLRLALLAPGIGEDILNVRQPAGLQLDSLLRRFPVYWRAQRDAFNTANGLWIANLPRIALLAAAFTRADCRSTRDYG